ncbi:transposase, partial [Palleronia caenipelagi]
EQEMGRHRREYADEFKGEMQGAPLVEAPHRTGSTRLYEPGATQGSVAKELGVISTQLNTWRPEIEVFGWSEAKRRLKADAAELERLRQKNKRLADKNGTYR